MSRGIVLAARPEGEPKASDFEVRELDDGEPADGEVLVRNVFISVDPYMRGRMTGVRTYIPPYELGDVINGCLSAEGRGLIHTIGRNRRQPLDPWIERRIFPGAYPPSLGQMSAIFEAREFSVLDGLFDRVEVGGVEDAGLGLQVRPDDAHPDCVEAVGGQKRRVVIVEPVS